MSKKYLKLGPILKRLLFDRDMKAADLAREIDIPPPTIHRLITGKSTRPYKTSLKPIADYFSITIDQLIGEEHSASELASNMAPDTKKQSIRHIPLFSWSDLQSLGHANLTYNSIPFAGMVSEHTFATTMTDSSMEPLFSRGTILIFDPAKIVQDRGYALIHLHEPNLIVFRQLLIDLEDKYLKPLNPDLSDFQMKIISENDKIIGTLVEARHVYIEQ